MEDWKKGVVAVEDISEDDKKVKANVIINRQRFCNVLFSDAIRPKLVTLGEKLKRVELDCGLEKDQKLHMSIAEEYNKKDVD